MAVRIRLRRMGRKKKPHYRVVVADQRKPRDGGFVESLGYYQPLSDPALIVIDLERFDYWVGQGASPSETVRSLVSKARKGGDDTVAVGVRQGGKAPADESEVAAGAGAEGAAPEPETAATVGEGDASQG
ncbi:MAG: 30S ribosomal protein S16 [Gemmatimonadales bacterium]|nr:MAG: 30S ribosomal protein S16 [Gemmatimonadales bacterium]